MDREIDTKFVVLSLNSCSSVSAVGYRQSAMRLEIEFSSINGFLLQSERGGIGGV